MDDKKAEWFYADKLKTLREQHEKEMTEHLKGVPESERGMTHDDRMQRMDDIGKDLLKIKRLKKQLTGADE